MIDDHCRLRMMLAADSPMHANSPADALFHADDSNKDLCQDTPYGNCGRWEHALGNHDMKTGSIGMFSTACLSHLLFFLSMDLNLVPIASAQVFTTSLSQSSGDGASLCTGSTERSHWGVLTSCGTDGFVQLRTWHCCLIAFFAFVSYSSMGLRRPEGLLLESAIM